MMNRIIDIDLLRLVLLKVEKFQEEHGRTIAVQGYSVSDVNLVIELLKKYKLLRVFDGTIYEESDHADSDINFSDKLTVALCPYLFNALLMMDANS